MRDTVYFTLPPIVLMAFFEDLKKTFTIDYPTVEQVYTEQVLTVPSHLYY